MLPVFLIVLGAFATAAPLADLEWLVQAETPEQVAKALGRPKAVMDFGQDFQSWQFQIGEVDHEDSSHQVVIRKSSRSLVSVAVNFEPQRNVDALFPEKDTTVHHYPDAKNPQLSLRLRHLSGGRVLMAIGSAKPGQTTGQLVVMREAELRFFYPWVTP